ncbi:MAG: hypothetical protein HOW73_35385 [Polyangiaceae bacterium]|nr:hypothetical protein [Polyangiaceae bacterium]
MQAIETCSHCAKTIASKPIVSVTCGCGGKRTVHLFHVDGKTVCKVCKKKFAAQAGDEGQQQQEQDSSAFPQFGDAILATFRQRLLQRWNGRCHACLGPSVVKEEGGKTHDSISAHCVVSNRDLLWYSPQIYAEFFRLTTASDNPSGAPATGVSNLFAGFDSTPQNAPAQFAEIGSRLARALDGCRTKRDARALLAAFREEIARRLLRLEANGVLAPALVATPPPDKGGGDPLNRKAANDTFCQAMTDAIGLLVGNTRQSAFEVGRQCKFCEQAQGEGALIQRYQQLTTEPGHHPSYVGLSFLREVHNQRNDGGVWRIVLDFLAGGLNPLLKKFSGKKDAETVALERAIRSNLALFALFYAACMLEANMGDTPFRDSTNVLPSSTTTTTTSTTSTTSSSSTTNVDASSSSSTTTATTSTTSSAAISSSTTSTHVLQSGIGRGGPLRRANLGSERRHSWSGSGSGAGRPRSNSK